MEVLKSVIRWLLAIFLGMTSLGSLFTGNFLGALIMLAGCAVIAPAGGAWLASKLTLLKSGFSQVALGFVAFVIGMTLSMSNESSSVKTGAAAPGQTAGQAPRAPKFQCEKGLSSDGAIVSVIGSAGHTLRTSPNGEKIVNEKATRAIGETTYQSIDNSTTVQLQCIDGDWARVQIATPEWLKEQVGWVERTALALPLKPGEVRDFVDADFSWDKDTKKAKDAIIKTVNRIHREDPRCKNAIYPSSVAKSDTESKAQKKPVYFVNCGDGAESVNVYFDAKRADDPTPFRAPGHIDQMRATDLCEAYAKANANHPSTVDFSRVLDLSISEHPNGRTRVTSSFTAKNSFNLELKFRINCLLDENGFIEGNVFEDS